MHSNLERDLWGINNWKNNSWLKGYFTVIISIILLFFVLRYISNYIPPIWLGYSNFKINFNHLLNFFIILLFIYLFNYKWYKSNGVGLKKFLFKLGIPNNNRKFKTALYSILASIIIIWALKTAFEITKVNHLIILGESLDTSFPKVFLPLAFNVFTEIISIALPEELFFRGYLQQMFYFSFLDVNKKINIPTIFSQKICAAIAIITSTLIFIFFHYTTFNRFTLGMRFYNILFGSMIFGYIFYKTREIFSVSSAHAVYNTINHLVKNLISDKINLIIRIYENDLTRGAVPKEIVGNLTEGLRKIGGI